MYSSMIVDILLNKLVKIQYVVNSINNFKKYGHTTLYFYSIKQYQGKQNSN